MLEERPSELISLDISLPSSVTEKSVPSPTSTYSEPKGWSLFLIMFGLLMSNLLVALDQTIVAAALPTIANDFHALSSIGWFASSYLLTSTAFQPFFGRAYTYFSLKYLFLLCIVIFELGSLVCAVAKDPTTFIVGRAIAGCGFGGLYIGVFAIVAATFPIRKQALFSSLIGLSYGIGASTGPIIGGTLTSKVTWRWCFWINLPIGAVTMIIIFLVLRTPPTTQTLTVPKRLLKLDWFGTALLLCSVTCLLLALQDGGVAFGWGSSRIIGLIVGFVLITSLYFGYQYWMGQEASLVLSVAADKNIRLLAALNFMIGTIYFSLLYFVPIYFQAVRGSSAIHSGVQTLPLIACIIFTITLSGSAVTKWGNYNYMILFGTVLMPIGSGLLSLLDANTSTGKWFGYQIVTGTGIGSVAMMCYIASQIVLPADTRPYGATIVIFFQSLGSTMLVSTATSIYNNRFLVNIRKIPGLDVAAVSDAGVTGFRTIVPPEQLSAVVDACVAALRSVFIGVACIGVVGFLLALPLEWKTMEKGEKIEPAMA